MKIIIVGDGKVGFTLAEHLSQEEHDITVIDTNDAALRHASEALDVMCVKGNGASISALRESGVDAADVLIAATSMDEVNMVCCLTAKRLGAKYAIARVRNVEYAVELSMIKRELGIDLVINRMRYEMVRRGDMMSVDDVVDILSIPLIGVVPDDENVVIATNQGEPLVGNHTLAGRAYRNICQRILGQETPYLLPEPTFSFWTKVTGIFHKSQEGRV